MRHTEIDPLKRNISVSEEIAALDNRKSEFIRKRKEKELEIDVINSDISLVEAQIANILTKNRRNKK